MLVAGAETLASCARCGFGTGRGRCRGNGINDNCRGSRNFLKCAFDMPFARDPWFRPWLNRTHVNCRTNLWLTRLEAWLRRTLVGMPLGGAVVLRPVVVLWPVETTVSAALSTTSIAAALGPLATIAVTIAALDTLWPVVVTFATLLGTIAPIPAVVEAVVPVVPVTLPILAIPEAALTLALFVVLRILLLTVMLARRPVITAGGVRSALLFLRKARHNGLLGLAKVVRRFIVVVRVGPVEPRPHLAVDVFAHLRWRQALLLAIGEYDAIVVLGVLQVVLSENRVTRRLGIASQLEVFLRDVCGRTAHLDVGTVRFIAPRQRVLPFARVLIRTAATIAITTVMIVAAPATAAMLLSLPHGLPFSG